jgi:hypothetical protein
VLPRTGRVDAWKAASLLAFLVLLVGCGRWSKSPVPSISFTRVPAADKDGYDKFAAIEGIARSFHPGQQIVLYSKSEELWWLQPVTDHPFTKIQDDSTWKTQIHLGTEYAALSVDSACVGGTLEVSVIAKMRSGQREFDSDPRLQKLPLLNPHKQRFFIGYQRCFGFVLILCLDEFEKAQEKA